MLLESTSRLNVFQLLVWILLKAQQNILGGFNWLYGKIPLWAQSHPSEQSPPPPPHSQHETKRSSTHRALLGDPEKKCLWGGKFKRDKKNKKQRQRPGTSTQTKTHFKWGSTDLSNNLILNALWKAMYFCARAHTHTHTHTHTRTENRHSPDRGKKRSREVIWYVNKTHSLCGYLCMCVCVCVCGQTVQMQHNLSASTTSKTSMPSWVCIR